MDLPDPGIKPGSPALPAYSLSAELPCLWVKATLLAQIVKRLSAMQETWVRSLSWEDTLEKEMAAHSSILAGKSHGPWSLVGYCPWGRK